LVLFLFFSFFVVVVADSTGFGSAVKQAEPKPVRES
jgi:hypothetical protein